MPGSGRTRTMVNSKRKQLKRAEGCDSLEIWIYFRIQCPLVCVDFGNLCAFSIRLGVWIKDVSVLMICSTILQKNRTFLGNFESCRFLNIFMKFWGIFKVQFLRFVGIFLDFLLTIFRKKAWYKN